MRLWLRIDDDPGQWSSDEHGLGKVAYEKSDGDGGVRTWQVCIVREMVLSVVREREEMGYHGPDRSATSEGGP